MEGVEEGGGTSGASEIGRQGKDVLPEREGDPAVHALGVVVRNMHVGPIPVGVDLGGLEGVLGHVVIPGEKHRRKQEEVHGCCDEEGGMGVGEQGGETVGAGERGA